MKTIRAGSLEMVLLSVVRDMDGKGYGVNIREEASKRNRSTVSFGALYTTLHRLEKHGLLTSQMGDPTPERGGRAKRYYRITGAGERALRDVEMRMSELLPSAIAPNPA